MKLRNVIKKLFIFISHLSTSIIIVFSLSYYKQNTFFYLPNTFMCLSLFFSNHPKTKLILFPTPLFPTLHQNIFLLHDPTSKANIINNGNFVSSILLQVIHKLQLIIAQPNSYLSTQNQGLKQLKVRTRYIKTMIIKKKLAIDFQNHKQYQPV